MSHLEALTVQVKSQAPCCSTLSSLPLEVLHLTRPLHPPQFDSNRQDDRAHASQL